MADMKMQDHVAGHEIAGHELAGHENAGQKKIEAFYIALGHVNLIRNYYHY